jgi:glucosamine--fructose-6-phosphate aminotransferase (isomerizing)
MTNPHSLMAKETAEAPDAVARMLSENKSICEDLAQRLKPSPPHLIVTCARGTSDHAATYAKYLLETRIGIPVASAAPSVSSVYHSPQAMRGALFLAISQSGKSPDLVAAASLAKQAGALVVAIVNTTESPLADAADIVLPLHAGPELSVAATKSFITSLASILQIVTLWRGDKTTKCTLQDLPEHLTRALELDWSAAAQPIADTENLFVVGRGLGFGIAQEAALKLKETSCLHAEAFSAAEVQHGPMALVGPGFPVLMFSQEDKTENSVINLANTFSTRSEQIFLTSYKSSAATPLPALPNLDPAMAPIAHIQTFYGLAEKIARLRGLNPDEPPHLKKVTETR